MAVETRAAAPRSPWAPLHIPLFRALWIAQFTSNIGTWMQTVGAQWLMGSLTRDPLYVALIQTATALPVFLVGFPAGALGDIFDRRRLLLISPTVMLTAAALLSLLTFKDDITPWILLGLTFAVGLGRALTAPSWQAIQPELVGRELIPHAAALNSTSMNLARAIGPAIGGVIVAAAGAGWVFALNAVSFLGVLAVLAAWRGQTIEKALGREHIVGAMRAGIRYARSSPRMRAVLVRASVFIIFGSALWALLPIVARSRLGLGSGGYGLMLGAVGAGAVLGAATLPRARARFNTNRVVAGASAAYGLVALALAWADSVPLVMLALVVGGYAWIAALSSLNSTAQAILPDWVRSRGLSLYLLVFFGGQALGSLLWGIVVQQSNTRVALTCVGVGLFASLLAGHRYALRPTRRLDLRPAQHWAEPDLAFEPDPRHGPVLVTVEYWVPLERAEEFKEAMQPVGRSRRRSGGTRWGLFQDGADPERFVEVYVVPTWEEHLRQHQERITHTDREFEERARSLLAPGTEPKVEHLFFAYDR